MHAAAMTPLMRKYELAQVSGLRDQSGQKLGIAKIHTVAKFTLDI